MMPKRLVNLLLTASVVAVLCLLPLSQAASGEMHQCHRYDYPKDQYIDANKLKRIDRAFDPQTIWVNDKEDYDSQGRYQNPHLFGGGAATTVYISSAEGFEGDVCVEAPYDGKSSYYYYQVRMHNPFSTMWFYTFRLEMNGVCCISRDDAGLPRDGYISSAYMVGSNDVDIPQHPHAPPS